jgi:dihydroorotase
VGFSAGREIAVDTQTLLRAMQYANTFGFTVWLRPQDPQLAREGVAHAGAVAARLGLPGVPAVAETVALHTVFELVRATGCRAHLCRLSSAAGVELMRRAKAEGLPVTCDVSVHHLHLIDVDIGWFDSHYRVDPPFRGDRDRDAIRAGVADGTIDAICSDHTPVDDDAKLLPFSEAEPGVSALELLLPLTLKWAAEAGIAMPAALAKITCAAAPILGVDAGRLQPGAPADLCLFDPGEHWVVDRERLRSQGKHTPYLGREVSGRVRATVVGGRVVFSRPS